MLLKWQDRLEVIAMKKVFGVITTGLLLIGMAAAQTPQRGGGNPVSDAMRQILERQSRNLVAAAETMPAEHFDFKPTPQQRSFGETVVHTADSNNFLCSSISGKAPKAKMKPAVLPDNKTAAADALKSSFDFCKEALGDLDDSHLAEQVPFFGQRKVSRAAAMFALTSDWADHYSAMATYLRLNKLLPPTAQRQGSGSEGTMKPLKP
jgi:uncharacterized damage-inducible protein DinB